jgi:hypothetical protein
MSRADPGLDALSRATETSKCKSLMDEWKLLGRLGKVIQG